MHLPRFTGTALLALIALAASACGSSGGASSTTTQAGSATSSGANRLGPAYDTTTAAAVTLNGAGANSIDPFFEKVFYDYHQKNPKTTINYSPAGSSVGIKDIQEGTVDFGQTEIPMSATDLVGASAGPVLQVPVALGGVAISYNVPGAPKNLKLDGPTLAGIFDGTITNWDDPEIASVSGVSNLPNLPIVAVHRADSSGPGWDLDAFLIKTAPAWVAKIGTTAPSKTWPLTSVGLGQQLNSGVATYIHQTAGAIGYVEYGYALQANFTNAALKNASGSFVAPSLRSIASSGSHATVLSASNFSIIDEPGAGSYPLANFSWTLLDQTQSDESKGVAAGKLFDYVVTTGQLQAAGIGYAPLPQNVVDLAVTTLEKLKGPTGSLLFAP